MDAADFDFSAKVAVPPYNEAVVWPMVRAEHFSPRLGGVGIRWHAHARNLAHWHEIDREGWRHLEAWNVAGKR